MQIIHGFLTKLELEQLKRIAWTESGWTRGRQGTGYEVLYLKNRDDLDEPINRARGHLDSARYDFWDAYLIRYKVGDYIPLHTDQAGLFGHKHRRLNAMVLPSGAGGILFVNKQEVALPVGDAILFDPDEEEHEVTTINDGERILFSVGAWVRQS